LTILILGCSGYSTVKTLQDDLNEALGVRITNLELIRASGVDIHQSLVAERTLFSYEPDSDEFQSAIETINKNIKQSKERMDEYKNQMFLEGEQELFNAYENYRMEWEKSVASVIKAAQSKDKAIRNHGLEMSMTTTLGIFDKMEESLDKLGDYYKETGEVLLQEQTENGKKLLNLLIILWQG
jgi:methyl-accepting chemotaxis protein